MQLYMPEIMREAQGYGSDVKREAKAEVKKDTSPASVKSMNKIKFSSIGEGGMTPSTSILEITQSSSKYRTHKTYFSPSLTARLCQARVVAPGIFLRLV